MTRTKLVILGSLLTAAACSDGGSNGSSVDAGDLADAGDAADAEVDAGADAGEEPSVTQGIVKGRVRYADGSPTGPLELSIGGKSYRSDNRGVFVADDVPTGKRQVVVTDPSTSAAQLEVQVSKKGAAQVDLAVLQLKTLDIANAEAASELSDASDGLKVKLPEKALRTKGGKAVSGAAKASYGMVKGGQDVKAAPGGLRAKVDAREFELESFGMLDLRFYQGKEKLALAKEIDIELPLGPNSYADGADIEAWSFDEDAGHWKSEGKAKVDKSAGGAGVAKLKAKHLSWWGVAEPLAASSCLSGRVLSAAEEPLSGVWVNAVGLDYWGSFWQSTDADGNFCLPVKAGSSNQVTAFGSSDATYYDYSTSLVAGAEAAACGGSAPCTEIGDFGPTALFDECTGSVAKGQDHVLILSSGDSELDTALSAVLESHGQAHTIGDAYTAFDGTLDLSAYDAVYLQANANWSSGDMPVDGQRQLINWVNCGGGLVTVEWTTWKIGSGNFQLIDAIFPAARTTAYGSPASETFSVVTPDATLNAGLEDSFTFATTNFAGVESNLNPRAGATIYYDSELDSGLLGWNYNLGRVASFSLVVGPNEVADENFSRLIANTINWVQAE